MNQDYVNIAMESLDVYTCIRVIGSFFGGWICICLFVEEKPIGCVFGGWNELECICLFDLTIW